MQTPHGNQSKLPENHQKVQSLQDLWISQCIFHASVNGLTQLAYADGAHWGALEGCMEMQRGLAARSLQRVHAVQPQIDGALDGLAEALGGMRSACALLRCL